MATDSEQDGRTRRGSTRRSRRNELILDALEQLLVETPLRDLTIEQIAEAAGITRTRFYSYYKSKHEAFAALLGRVAEDVHKVYDLPDSWLSRPVDVRPRDSLIAHIERVAQTWLKHAPVFREASDLWNAAPEASQQWHQIMTGFAERTQVAIERERELAVAPPGPGSRELAEALIWQGERLFFLLIRDREGAMSTQEIIDVGVSVWLRSIYLNDDPDPVAPPRVGMVESRQR